MGQNKQSLNRPKIIAHRGASFLSKENTLESFQKAIDVGADMVELDIQMTKDNKLIVLHDKHIDRISEGTGLVRNFTLEDIRRIPIFGKEKIPTFEQVLEILVGKVGIVIDLKWTDSVPYLLKYLKDEKLRKSVIVSSFKKHAIRSIKDFDESIEVGLICRYPSPGKIKFCVNNKIDNIHPYVYYLTKHNVKKMKEEGLGINTWTVNYQRRIKKVCQLGVDGIITDRPKKIKEVIHLCDLKK